MVAAAQSVKHLTAKEFRRKIVGELLGDLEPISNKVKHGRIQINVALRPEDYIQMQIRPEDYDTWREKTIKELGLRPHFHRICNPNDPCRIVSDDERLYDERIPDNMSIQFFIPNSLLQDNVDEKISSLLMQMERVLEGKSYRIIEEASIAVLYDLTGRGVTGLNEEIPPSEEYPIPTTLTEDCTPMLYGVGKSTYFIAKNAYLSPHQFVPEPNPVFFGEAAGNTSGSRRPPLSEPPVTALLHGIKETDYCGPTSQHANQQPALAIKSYRKHIGKIKLFQYADLSDLLAARGRQFENNRKERKAKHEAEKKVREAAKKVREAEKEERAIARIIKSIARLYSQVGFTPEVANEGALAALKLVKADIKERQTTHITQAQKASAAAASSNSNSTFKPADPVASNASKHHRPSH